MLCIPSLIFFVIYSFSNRWNKYWLFTIVHLFFVLLFFFSEYLSPYNFSAIVTIKQHHFINLAKEFNSGSYIDIPLLSDSFLSFLINIPNALLNSMFRPFIWESHNLLALVSSIENLILFVFIVLTIIFRKKQKINQWVFISFSFSFLLFILIGIATPVLGALVRYKVPALPFLSFLLIYYIDIEKLNKILPLWRK